MDERQDKAFREAVERKKAQAKRRGEATNPAGDPAPEGDPLPERQPSLTDDSVPQETVSPRAKSQGHGKKTADKWNQ